METSSKISDRQSETSFRTTSDKIAQMKRPPPFQNSDRYKDEANKALELAKNTKLAASQAPLRIDPTILYNNNPCHPAFVVHKILDYLQEKKEMVSSIQLEQHFKSIGFTGLNILSNKEIFNSLQSSNRILFDDQRKKFAYINPYEKIVSSEALLASIAYDGQFTGLRVSDDLLAANDSMKIWIHELLKERKIRCIRPNNSHLRGKFKCKMANTENVCSIYSKVKCQECYDNVKDLILYPLTDSQYESARLKLNSDIKALWDSIEMPPLEDILKEFNINTPLPKFSNNESSSSKRTKNPQKRIPSKMRRIFNVHLFTPEELRSEIQQQQNWSNNFTQK